MPLLPTASIRRHALPAVCYVEETVERSVSGVGRKAYSCLVVETYRAAQICTRRYKVLLVLPPRLTPAYPPTWQTFAQHELAEAVARESDLELLAQAQQVGQSFFMRALLLLAEGNGIHIISTVISRAAHGRAGEGGGGE